MKSDKIKQAIEIIRDYNQFQRGRLWDDIQFVLKCSEAVAKDKADSHCNMVSFWSGMYLAGHTSMSYREFFSKMLTTIIKDPKNGNNYGCRDDGYLNVSKECIAKQLFGYNFKPVFFEDFEDVVNPTVRLDPDSWYQMKIKNSDHYMLSCLDDNGIMLIFCTGKRGVGVPAIGASRIDEQHFKWLMEILCA